MPRILLMVVASLMICITTASFAAETPAGQKTGVIKSVDAKASTFVLTLPARPLTFTVDDKTVITLDGKASTFEAAIKSEFKASVTYTRSGQDRIASKVDVTAAAAK